MSVGIVSVVALGLLAGCASRGSVRRVERELASVSTQVGELGKLNEATGRDLARAIAELRELQSGATRLNREEGEVIRQLSRVEERLAAAEGTIRELRGAFTELAREVSRAASPPAPEPAAREQAVRPASPEQLYAAALANMRAGEHGQAVLDFLDFIAKYPGHPLSGNAQYWIGEAYYLQRDFRQALVEFQHVVGRYGKNNKTADALLKIGLCYQALREPVRAQETWGRLVAEFPRSEAARRARVLMQAPRAAPARSR
ncbi:MAG: tol-pal system protein YbgF [Candidatus Rokubacteria bacterium]|nr:tol-pal system protein YbgF [Candidatus Rokubacteria bacterium]